MGKNTDDWAALEPATTPAPVAGQNAETLRRALAMNPAMREQLNTQDVIDVLGGKKQTTPAPQQRRDLAEIFAETKRHLLARRQQIKDEMQKLDADLRALGPEAFERLYAALMELDPNLTGLQTAELFSRERELLTQIGLSPKSFLDRKQQKSPRK